MACACVTIEIEASRDSKLMSKLWRHEHPIGIPRTWVAPAVKGTFLLQILTQYSCHTVYALDPYAPLSPQIPTPAPSSSANAAAIAASSVVSTSICVSKLVEFDGVGTSPACGMDGGGCAAAAAAGLSGVHPGGHPGGSGAR